MKLIKTVPIVITMLCHSITAQAERRIYNNNQGIKPEVFDASYFDGQWTVNKPKLHHHGAISHFKQSKKPIIVMFTSSGVKELNNRIEFFSERKIISHAKASIRLEDCLKHEIDSIHYDKYLSENLPGQKLSYKQNKSLRKSFLSESPVVYSDYDDHSMTYYTYSKNGNLLNYNTMVLFDYKKFKNMAPVPKDIMEKNIEWYKEKFNFDVINGTDFIIKPGWMSSFVYIDIVSDDLFLMYGDKKEQSFVSGFKRIKSVKSLTPWKDYFNSIDD